MYGQDAHPMTSHTVTTTVTTSFTLNDSDNLTLTSTGSIIVSGTTAAVYDRGSIGTLVNAGEISGRTAIHADGDIATLSNSGTLAGTAFDAVFVKGGIGTITNTGLIDASRDGIFVANGNLTMLDNSTSGVITGRTGLVVGGDIGTLSNEGTIAAASSAIYDYGTIGTLTNAGDIKGYYGIEVTANGSATAIGSLSNSGQISGTGCAIAVNTGNLTSLDNATGAVISGSATAVYIQGAIGTLTNAGTITGGTSAVLSEGSIGTLTNDGYMHGGYEAIFVGSGTLGILDNETGGTINGGDLGIDVDGAIGTLTNEGTISGHTAAIYVTGTVSTLTNEGTIKSDEAIDASAIGTFINGGYIAGTYGGIVATTGSITSLYNNGLITSTSAQGVYAAGGIATLTNVGEIAGGNTAIRSVGMIGSLANEGTIKGDPAIQASAIGTITNGGAILSSGQAIYAVSGGLSSLDNGKYIHASGNAVDISGAIGTLTNEGLITANRTAIVSGSGIGSLTNQGEIIASHNAIYAQSGTLASLTNEAGGVIQSESSNAVDAAGGIGTLTNQGTINGYSDAIVTNGTISTLTNDGTISANYAVEATEIGTITNSGDILANRQAIFAGDTLTSLNNETGASIHASGDAITGDGSIGTLTNEGSISGNSTAIFSRGDIGILTNSGSITGGTDGETIYTNGSIGDLDNSGVISSASYSTIYVNEDIGTLTNEGSISDYGISATIFVAGTIGTLINSGTLFAAGGTPIDAGAIGTLENSGSIEGFVQVNGDITSLDNTTGGTINGLEVNGTIGTLTNEGNLLDYIQVGAIGMFTNSADITGGGGASAFLIQDNGNLTDLDNKAGAVISTSSATALFVGGTIGTLTNEGVIGSYISRAIEVFGDIDDLSNSGTISGAGNQTAVIHSNGTIVTLTNEGSILSQAAGISASAVGTITNSGTIAANSDAIRVGGNLTSLDNVAGGSISANSTVIAVAGTISMLSNAGTISGGDYGIIAGGMGTIENAGTISGGIDAIISSQPGGTLVLDPTSVIDGNVEFNDGTLELAGSAPSDVGGIGTQYTGFTTIEFDGVDDLAVGNVSGLASGQSITGFASGDTIGIDDFSAVSDDYVAGVGLVLTDANSNTETLDIVGAYSTANFEVLTNGIATLVMELCYLRGTRILTPNGEVPVESLQIGDLVVTRQGGFRAIKWIGRQSYNTRFVATDPARLPVRIRPGALGEGLPARDLYISPGHSMLVDGTLLLASALVNGITITHECPNDTTQIDYFQPELQSHDCILAEGAWSETFADGPGLRAAYHNAPEFWALYPTYQTPDTIHLCAPRPERGNALETALRPLVARAARGVAPGHLQGSIDRVSGREIDGWAFDAANPHLPVLIEVTLDGAVIHTALACDFRPDLKDAGFALGRCAFFLSLPEEIPAGVLQIRRASDGATVPMSEPCRAACPPRQRRAA
jgi:hypothetical protein